MDNQNFNVTENATTTGSAPQPQNSQETVANNGTQWNGDYVQNSNPVQQGYNGAYQQNRNPVQQGYNGAYQQNRNPVQAAYNPNYQQNRNPVQAAYNPNYQQNRNPVQVAYNPNYQQNRNPVQQADGNANEVKQGNSVPSYTPVNTSHVYNCGQVNNVASAPITNTGSAYVPQYHHGQAYYPVFNQQYYEERRKIVEARTIAEKKVRSICSVAGGSLLFSYLVSNLFSLVLAIPVLYAFYESGVAGSSFFNIIYSLVTVLGGFWIYDIFFKNHAKKQKLNSGGVDCYSFKTSFKAPQGFSKTMLLIGIGFGGCMLSNYVSSYLLTFIESFGVTSSYSAIESPQNIQDIVLMCIATAIIPPLTEELAIRGILMSRLRRYGNWFAIVASAFIFGVFHGTFAQIPFAFGCGLFIGYAVIATESLWTGVIIHFLNNILSCIASVMIEYGYATEANLMFSAVSLGGIVIGLICFLVYHEKYRTSKKDTDGGKFKNLAKTSVNVTLLDGVSSYQGDAFELKQGEKLKIFFSNPLVIVGTVLYALLSLLSLEFY